MLTCPKCHSFQLRVRDFTFDPWRVNMICAECGHTFKAPWTRYNTHLPVLYALGTTFPIRQIIELGCGIYSTPTFCNREVYPFMERMLSIEDSVTWAEGIREACPDKRLIIAPVPRFDGWLLPYAQNMRGVDLIFIDDTGKRRRAETIRFISELHVSGLVVIHDYHQPAYIAAAVFDHVVVTPFDTALCWNGQPNHAIMDLMEQWKGMPDVL